MTADFSWARDVRCPTCADEFPWVDDGNVSVFDETTGTYELIDIGDLEPVKRANVMRLGYRRCPNPSGDMSEHYLPATWGDYEDPLVIGMIGQTLSGKTHLLTAMIREAHRGGLQPFGVQTRPLDFMRHDSFKSRFIRPFERGDQLEGTGSDVLDAADVLLLRAGPTARPVMFFDVSGEDLNSYAVQSRVGRFVLAMNAAIFVHAAEDVETGGATNAGENPVFELSVERILSRPDGADIPVAIALTKSDRLRYVPPVDRWLRRGPEQTRTWLDARTESRDVYAYLHQSGAASSLTPYESFTRCTLHFVSASGGDAVRLSPGSADGIFERGIRPVRVLEPLIAILSMSGLIRGPEAERVGVW